MFSKHLSEKEKCEKVVAILKKRGRKQFKDFCTALKVTGHEELVEELLSKAGRKK